MNKLLLIIFTMTLALPMLGQGEYCSQEAPTEESVQLRMQQRHLNYMDMPEGDVQYVPVQLHIVSRTDGTGAQPDGIALNQVCYLNEHYAPNNIYFWIYDTPNYIMDDDWYFNDPAIIPHGSRRNQLLNEFNVDDVVNVYFVGDWQGLCGISIFPFTGGAPDEGGMVLDNGCAFTNTHKTFPHEMGHYFNLLHTHEDFMGQENVDRDFGCKNCETAGDFFCDTPADFNPSNERWECSDPQNNIDPCDGSTFTPDGSAYMSYADDDCQNHFSPESIAEQTRSLLEDRPYLLDWDDPTDFDPVAQVERLTPEDDAVNVPYNDVTLTWNPVPNADYYHVKFIRGANVIEHGNVTDPSYHVQQELLFDAKYRWTVMAYSKGNTCGTYPVNWEFRTNDPTVGIEENQALSNSISVIPNPVSNGTVEFRFNKEQTSSFNIQIVDMTGKVLSAERIDRMAAGQGHAVSTEDLQSGIYFARIIGEEAQATKRFVVVN